MINIKMQPTEVQKLSPKITVIGVGGAGGNAVNNMISSSLDGCEFLVCNTDAQALENSLCENRLQLGVNVTGGLGAGSKPDIGKAAAEESLEEVMQYLEGANMVFVTAGMGGGTGTGAAPLIAKACRERGVLTVGVVTKPFHFEGNHRMKMAEEGLSEMQDVVDTLIVIPNQNLFRIANEKTTFADGFKMADSVLQSGVRGVTDLMVRPGLVNLDFADIRTAMLEMGKAMMGTGEATGEKRAIEAAESAINNPLLDDVSMKGAHGVIINVTGGYDMTLFEADEACNRIRDEVDPDANIIFGATFDESMDGAMRVSIVATGIEKESLKKALPSSGGRSVDATGKKSLERATPNTEMRAAATSAPAVRAAIKSAPVMQTPEVQDPELDMFDQQKFSAAALQVAGQEAVSVPQNTALRGERYKGAFIPPMPAEAGLPEAAPSAPVAAAPTGFHTAPAIPAVTQVAASPAPSSAALNLNPPKLPTPGEVKRSPSLFERISGTVQHHLEGVMGDHDSSAQRQRTAPSPRSTSGTAPLAPSQGVLSVESPAGKAKASDDELDIPAFLRRQAN